MTKKTGFLSSIFFALFLIFPLFIKKEGPHPNSDFRPDLVFVLTGDQGRIDLAKSVRKNYPLAWVSISGIGNNRSFSEIKAPKFLDYSSKSTLENILYLKKLVSENPELKNIVIISSDYHYYRIEYLIEKLLLSEKNQNFVFKYQLVRTNYWSPRNFKIYYKEIYKLLGSYMIL